jgi:hypothetical protein
MWVNNLRHGEGFLGQFLDDPLIKSVLYLQGEHAFLMEFMAYTDDEVFRLIRRVKGMESVAGAETHEVLSIIKYRGVLQEAPMAPPKFIIPSRRRRSSSRFRRSGDRERQDLVAEEASFWVGDP